MLLGVTCFTTVVIHYTYRIFSCFPGNFSRRPSKCRIFSSWAKCVVESILFNICFPVWAKKACPGLYVIQNICCNCCFWLGYSRFFAYFFPAGSGRSGLVQTGCKNLKKFQRKVCAWKYFFEKSNCFCACCIIFRSNHSDVVLYVVLFKFCMHIVVQMLQHCSDIVARNDTCTESYFENFQAVPNSSKQFQNLTKVWTVGVEARLRQG